MTGAPADDDRDAYVIAVDGGASKTVLTIVRADGAVLATARGAGSNQHHVGVAGTVAVIADVYATAMADLRTARPAQHAVYVLAGADTPEEERTLADALRALGWSNDCTVRNDTYAVLRAGTDRGWGVAVVCGAGINAVGVAPDGREARYPALGPLSGDWGGGLELGQAAVGAANRAGDGRGAATTLAESVPAHFGMRLPSDVALAFHRKQLDEMRIAELAPLVLAASGDGDIVARSLVDRLAREVLDLVVASLRRLSLLDTEVDVVLGGGLMQGGNAHLDDTLDRAITAAAPHARVIRPHAPPIAGAVLLALDHIGQTGVSDVVRAAFASAGAGVAPVAARGGFDG